MPRINLPKLTESVFPLILLLSGIFFILLYVEYRASKDAETTYYIHITAKSSVNIQDEEQSNSVMEVDFSSDPRVIKAQKLIEEKEYAKAEVIYFTILAEEPSAQIHNWLGTLYLKEKLYTKALVSFSNALKLNPDYYRARYNRALIYSMLDEHEKAIRDYKAVITGFENHAKSHFNMGVLYYQKKEYALAIAAFKRTSEISSGEKKIKALYLLGRSQMKIEPAQNEAARESFEKVIRLKPDHIASRLALVDMAFAKSEAGEKQRLEEYALMLEMEPANIAIYSAMYEAYHALGQEKAAKAIIQKALLHEPNNISMRFALVQTLIRLKQYSEAISQLQKILIIAPENTKAYFLLGRANYLKGSYTEALSVYEKVMDLTSRPRPELWNNIGLLYSKMERFDEAHNAYMQALALRSEYPEVYYNLGVLMLKQKVYEEAASYFNKAVSQRGSYRQAYYNLGLVYAKLGRNKDAIKAYQRVLELDPDNIRVQLNLAVRYSKVGELSRAQKLYETILEGDSTYYTAWLNLGLVYQEQKAYNKAIEALNKAVELEPESKKAHRSLAKNYSLNGDYKAATAILYKLLAQDPADIKTRLAYARSYYRAKKRNTALREYKKVLKLNPDNKVALKMIEKIETKKRNKNVKQ